MRQPLTSVLAHEGAHLLRRDPLRLSPLRFLACWLLWIPALRRLAGDTTAFITFEDGDFEDGGLLDRRIRRVAGELVSARSHLTRRSLLGAFAALSLAWTSGLLIANRMAPPWSSPCCIANATPDRPCGISSAWESP